MTLWMLKIVSNGLEIYANHIEIYLELMSIAGEDITDPHKEYSIKVFSYKIKSAPDADTVSTF